VSSLWDSLSHFISNIIPDFKTMFTGLVKVFNGFFEGDFDKMIEGAKEVMKGFGGFVYDLFVFVGTTITNSLIFLFNSANSFWDLNLKLVIGMMEEAVNTIIKLLVDPIDKVIGWYNMAANYFGFDTLPTASDYIIDKMGTNRLKEYEDSLKAMIDERRFKQQLGYITPEQIEAALNIVGVSDPNKQQAVATQTTNNINITVDSSGNLMSSAYGSSGGNFYDDQRKKAELLAEETRRLFDSFDKELGVSRAY
jgi:hypothetical protein